MRRLIITATARDDLAGIQDYLTRRSRSVATAENFIAKLTGHCEHLATLPATMGRLRPELMADIRSTTFGNYVLFLRTVGDDVVELVHVIEGHRDIDAFFAAKDEDD